MLLFLGLSLLLLLVLLLLLLLLLFWFIYSFFIYLCIYLCICLFLLLFFFHILLCQQVNSIMVALKHLLGCRGGEGLVQFTLNLGCLGQAQCRRRYILAYSTQFLIRIRLVPGNVVMVATDMYRKRPYGSGYTEFRKKNTIFVQFCNY